MGRVILNLANRKWIYSLIVAVLWVREVVAGDYQKNEPWCPPGVDSRDSSRCEGMLVLEPSSLGGRDIDVQPLYPVDRDRPSRVGDPA